MSAPDKALPVTGAWRETHEPGERQFINIGDLELESGEVLANITIAYQSWGELNKNRDNAHLVIPKKKSELF